MLCEGTTTTLSPPHPPLPSSFRYRITCCVLADNQTTTTGKEHWYWTDDSFTTSVAILQLELAITKFEYTSVKEVDPVDAWAIIGAIGGVWRKCALRR